MTWWFVARLRGKPADLAKPGVKEVGGYIYTGAADKAQLNWDK